ncbi:MAG: hypothetical protein NUV83_02715 [Candidatus Wolfebacteria bacterium]|nr:hypothetical protein [Candidatus Wolfebacteria bacterium]
MKAFTVEEDGRLWRLSRFGLRTMAGNHVYEGIDVWKETEDAGYRKIKEVGPYLFRLTVCGTPKVLPVLDEEIVRIVHEQEIMSSKESIVEDIDFQYDENGCAKTIIAPSRCSDDIVVYWRLGRIYNSLIESENSSIAVVLNNVRIIALGYDWDFYGSSTGYYPRILVQLEPGGEVIVPITYRWRFATRFHTRIFYDAETKRIVLDSEKSVQRSAFAENIGKVISL